MKILRYLILAFLLTILNIPPSVSAQTGLRIDPASSFFTAIPGQTRSIYIKTTNLGQLQGPPTIVYYDFKASSDGTGAPLIITDQDSNYAFGLKDWLSGPSSLINLGANQTNNLEFTLTVPQSTPEGTYTGIIVIKDTQQDGEEALASSIGSIVIVNVGASLPSVDIGDNYFVDKETGDISVSITNTSKHYFKPRVVFVESGNTGQILESTNLNVSDGGVLPGTERIFVSYIGNINPESTYEVIVYSGETELAREKFPDLTVTEASTDDGKEVIPSSDKYGLGDDKADATELESDGTNWIVYGLIAGLLALGVGITAYILVRKKKSMLPTLNMAQSGEASTIMPSEPSSTSAEQTKPTQDDAQPRQ